MNYAVGIVLYLILGHFLAYHVLRSWHRNHPKQTRKERDYANAIQVVLFGYFWPLGLLISMVGMAATLVCVLAEVHADCDIATGPPDDTP